MNDTEKLELGEILEKEGISSSDLEKFFKSRRTSGELGDDEVDTVSGGGCARSDSYTCPKCGQPLTWVSYHDEVDDSTRAYYSVMAVENMEQNLMPERYGHFPTILSPGYLRKL